MTHAERATAVIDKVKSELTPIWLGGRQRMMLEKEITAALEASKQEGYDQACSERVAALQAAECEVWEEVKRYLCQRRDDLKEHASTCRHQSIVNFVDVVVEDYDAQAARGEVKP